MPKSRDLTVQQQRFADGVLAGRSGREAYESAGYKARGAVADSCASELLRNPKVASYLEAKRAKIADRNEITAERIARGLLLEAEHRGKGSSPGARVSAWGLLAKIQGMLVEKSENRTTGEITVVFRHE